MSIRYKNVLERLRDAGLPSTRIRNERLMSESTLTRLRTNRAITTDTIDILCNLLHCQPNDIIEIIYEE